VAALEVICAVGPDVIVADLDHHDLDGLVLCRRAAEPIHPRDAAGPCCSPWPPLRTLVLWQWHGVISVQRLDFLTGSLRSPKANRGRDTTLTQRRPSLLPLSITVHRARRRYTWARANHAYAQWDASVETLFVVTRHGSVLMRRLGTVDMRLQRNKIVNLQLAAATICDRVIKPGQTLSVWRCIGNPTSRRGYLPGLMLGSDGTVGEGVGGGLCQIAKLLHWMVLHTPLTVTERHHHGYDIFPDSGRVLPFGTGAGIFYSYVDYCFANPTEDTYRMRSTPP
jgi:vancomycin resistance protein VanW